MTRDFDLDFNDPDLEQRVRKIARGADPVMPDRIARYADRVAGRGATSQDDRLVLEKVRRPALIPRPGRTALALAMTMLVAVVGVAGLVALKPNVPAGSASTSAEPTTQAAWSGLEWRDITATAFPASWVVGSDSGTPTSVVYWHGAYYANPATILWSSPDGIVWHQVDGAPGAIRILATDHMLVLSGMGCATSLSYSTDGRHWTEAELPLNGSICSSVNSVAANSSAILAVMLQDRPASSPEFSPVLYRSTDGLNWTTGVLPAEMAQVTLLGLVAGRSGFLASGTIRQNIQVTNGGESWTGEAGYWYSSDGSNWQQTAAPSESFGLSSIPIQRAGLGDWMDTRSPDGRGYHTFDDLTWIPDSEPAAFSQERPKISSDGERILAQTTGPAFYVSPGDGTWRQLVSGGDTGGMPADGASWVMPAGVLYVGDGHVFFGSPIRG